MRCERKPQKDTITRPYAHAGLAPGEANMGTLSDETCYISLVLLSITRKRCENSKTITYVAFRGPWRVRVDDPQLVSMTKTRWMHTRSVWRAASYATSMLKGPPNDVAAFRCTHVAFCDPPRSAMNGPRQDKCNTDRIPGARQRGNHCVCSVSRKGSFKQQSAVICRYIFLHTCSIPVAFF